MARRRRNASPTGVPTLDARQALRLQVVKGVLVRSLTLEQGAARLGVDVSELARLVEGARRAVIATLGEAALEEATAAAG